jgi:hypothetical protein
MAGKPSPSSEGIHHTDTEYTENLQKIEETVERCLACEADWSETVLSGPSQGKDDRGIGTSIQP